MGAVPRATGLRDRRTLEGGRGSAWPEAAHDGARASPLEGATELFGSAA